MAREFCLFCPRRSIVYITAAVAVFNGEEYLVAVAFRNAFVILTKEYIWRESAFGFVCASAERIERLRCYSELFPGFSNGSMIKGFSVLDMSTGTADESGCCVSLPDSAEYVSVFNYDNPYGFTAFRIGKSIVADVTVGVKIFVLNFEDPFD